MKAVALIGIGGLEKLQYTSLDAPIPGKDEILVKVLYCGINHLDLLIREGKRPGPKIFPHVLGSEIVGEVDGQNVAVYPWIFCGECLHCKNGNEQMCNKGGIIGKTQWGGYAQYVNVPAQNIIKIPSGLPLYLACAITLAGITAYHLVQKANIPNGAVVLVTGATGGVGTSVVQLLKYKKCRIICTTSHEHKSDELKKLGSDYVVSVQHLTSDVKALFSSGVSYVIDLVGGDVWSKAVSVLGKNGKIAFCSTSRDELGQVDLANAFGRELTMLGSNGGTRKDFAAVITLLKKGVLKPVIDSVYVLQDARNAQEKLEKQHVFGKIVLKI